MCSWEFKVSNLYVDFFCKINDRKPRNVWFDHFDTN